MVALGAIAGCHCTGEGDDQLWGSGRGAIAGCLCSVLGEWRVTANFGGGAIPAAIIMCYGWGGG